MNWLSAMRARKLASLAVISSIVGLTLIGILPWISVNETHSTGEIITTYNFAMMEKSENTQINSLLEDLELISIFFWLVIIFGIFSFIGLIFQVSEKYSPLAKLLMILGCATIIFNILIVLFLGNWINEVGDLTGISTLAIGATPVRYAYLPLIMGIVSLIGSIFYTGFILVFTIKWAIKSIKQKELVKKRDLKQYKQMSHPYRQKEIVTEKKITQEKEESSTKSFGKNLESRKDELSEDKSESKLDTETLEDKSKENEEKIADKTPFSSNRNVEKDQHVKETSSNEIDVNTQDSEEPPVSHLFNEALSSAVKKRESKLKKIEKSTDKKKISIRCPECKNVFTVEKSEEVTKIECPKCGKKGKIK